jgi:peptidoglycan/LPS O-acetylase OafA/YrhL
MGAGQNGQRFRQKKETPDAVRSKNALGGSLSGAPPLRMFPNGNGYTCVMAKVEKGSQNRMPELDGIRGLAILAVLCSHLAGLSGILNEHTPTFIEKLLVHIAVPMGNGGVDLFFVLSGFLITGILLRTKSAKNYFYSFYGRRVLRIFPIYYLVLTLCVVIGHFSFVIASELPPGTAWKVSYFFYLQNWPVFWHGHKTMTGLWGAYWSLAVEEQFYFVWPLVILLFSEKVVLKLCYIALPCALLLRIFLYFSYFDHQFGLMQFTPSRVDGLLMGAICSIYMFSHKRPVPMGWIIACGTLGSCIMLYIFVFHWQEVTGADKWYGTVGVTGVALLSTALVAVSQHKISFLQRLLSLRWLQLSGKYSYGAYVYHLILILGLRHYVIARLALKPGLGIPFGILAKCLAALIEIICVFLLAKASYDLFETPFLRLKSRFKAA